MEDTCLEHKMHCIINFFYYFTKLAFLQFSVISFSLHTKLRHRCLSIAMHYLSTKPNGLTNEISEETCPSKNVMHAGNSHFMFQLLQIWISGCQIHTMLIFVIFLFLFLEKYHQRILHLFQLSSSINFDHETSQLPSRLAEIDVCRLAAY